MEIKLRQTLSKKLLNMKKTILGFVLLAVTLSTLAQKKIEVKSDMKSATVYLSGAELNRTASVILAAGNSDVVFTGLPTNLNQQTINIYSDEKLIIQSVQFKLNYMAAEQLSAETKKWNDSLEEINKQLTIIKDKKDILILEAHLLNDNNKIAGQNTGLNFDVFKQYHDYYIEKTIANKSQWREQEAKEVKLNEIKNKLTQQLYDFQQKKSAPSGEIWVQVTSDKAIASKFYITYLVNNAGWTPEYDVRADKVNAPITLNYKAAIWQTTGEDWKDIKLKLSTGNPSAGAAGPIFATWFMDYYYGNNISNGSLNDYDKINDNTPSAKTTSELNVTVTGAYKKYRENETTSSYTSVTQSTLSTEFEIKLSSNIPSGSDLHRVNIGDYAMDASYDYYSIPRLDKDVFLNAHIADWEKLNLLPGSVTVFFQGAYVGQSYINANQTNDTMDLSLGRDKNVILTREKLKDFTKEKFIGGKYRQSVTYEIKIKNNESTEISLNVIEQIPISANAEIKISIDDIDGGTYNVETGKLLWKQKLTPGEEKKMQFSITVEFPESKKAYCPSF